MAKFSSAPSVVPTTLAFLVVASVTSAQTTVTLDASFVERYKNRVTIEASYIVDKAHPRPNPPSKDGDMHVAGRSPQDIRLATVAEIQNAASAQAAVDAVHNAEGTNQKTKVIGVWRLWPEHGGQHN